MLDPPCPAPEDASVNQPTPMAAAAPVSDPAPPSDRPVAIADAPHGILPHKQFRSDWKHRRWTCICTLIFCALLLGFIAVRGRPTALDLLLAAGLMLIAVMTIGSYVFGASWDDKTFLTFVQGKL